MLRPKELNDFDEIGLGRTKLIFRKSSEQRYESADYHERKKNPKRKRRQQTCS
jgi:hypothetical protein